MNPPFRNQNDPEKRDALPGVNEAGLAEPEGVEDLFRHQMRRQRLDPRRVDLRRAAEVAAARLDPFGGDQPGVLLSDQTASGPEDEFHVPGDVVFPLFGPLGDAGQHAGQNGAVDRVVGNLAVGAGGPVGREEFRLAQKTEELNVDVRPFAHPKERQKVLPARLAQLRAGQAVFQVVPEPPELEIRKEIGPLVEKRRVRLVGFRRRFGGAFARVLYFERRGNHQNVVHHPLVDPRQDDPRQTRVDRQTAQTAADLGDFVLPVERAEFVERLVAVENRPARRRVEEGKPFDRAEPIGDRPQNDRGEVRPAYFGRGELVTRGVVLFAVKPYADSRTRPPAPPGALVRRGARNRLDRQTLHPAARRVAAHPRRAEIDDVADSRHGQGRLGDVRGDHDLAPFAPGENLLLFGG